MTARTLSVDDRPRRKTPALQPTLLLAFQCEQPHAPPWCFGLASVEEAVVGRAPARSAASQGTQLIIGIDDLRISTRHARLTREMKRWVVEDLDSKNGVRVNGVPSRRSVLSDGDLLELGHTFLVFRERGLQQLATAPHLALNSLHEPLVDQWRALARIARSATSILLRGESGTGKEVAARAAHQLSGRTGAFVAVNCAAIPATLAESTLFGHKKGAFSGALADSPGLVLASSTGTLFLDEVGDLHRSTQAMLLRTLQEREVTPVGGTTPVPVDLRVISATHRDLEGMVTQRSFRGDLLARLAGWRVDLPPLQQRKEDLGLLIASILQRTSRDRAQQISLSVEASRALLRYSYPFNVRELEKALGAAVALADDVVDLEHLPLNIRDQAVGEPLSGKDAARRATLVALLAENEGNVSAVARSMGKARMQIQRWIKRYRIDSH